MTRELIIDDSFGFMRAALMEGGKLCELHMEKNQTDAMAESIYLGRVQSIKPAMSAAFVDIGEALHAFLPMEEDMHLRCGDLIVVQVLAKQATSTKGLRITHKVNLAGKWLVLLPGDSGVRISKKVKDPELRSALLECGQRICPDGCGLIVRTASGDVTEQKLEEEAVSLHARWQSILQASKGMRGPGLLDRRLPLHLRLVRDLRDLSGIVVNSQTSFLELTALQKGQGISSKTVIEHFAEKSQLIFDAYQIETQIDKALKKRVWLPCGGYLIIDYCEAMTVIDVNSGKMVLGRDLEETALHVNMEAADEIARQLRLRDIGGMVVIDFIDMKLEEHRQALIQHMREATSQDRTQINVEGITRLGLMELTRKRVNSQLNKILCSNCSYCSSNGETISGEETARRAMRQIKRLMLCGQRGPFVIRCHPTAAQALLTMRAPRQTDVYVISSAARHTERFDIEQTGSGIAVSGDAAALQHED